MRRTGSKLFIIAAMWATSSMGIESVWAQATSPGRASGQSGDRNNSPGQSSGRGDPGTAARSGQQSGGSEADRGTDAGSGAAAHAGSADSHIANCLLLGNQEEVTLARFALKQAQSDKTKQFAQQMIDDHSKMIAELEKFGTHSASQLQLDQMTASANDAGQSEAEGRQSVVEGGRGQGGTSQGQSSPGGAASGAGQSGTGQAGTGQPGTGQAGTGQPRLGQPGAGERGEGAIPGTPRVQPNSAGTATTGFRETMGPSPEQIFALDLRVKQECVALTKEDLKKAGKDFDMAYVGLQVAMHTQMLAQLRAAERSASEELRPILRKGIETTMQHKEHAVHLKSELKESSDKGQRRDK